MGHKTPSRQKPNGAQVSLRLPSNALQRAADLIPRVAQNLTASALAPSGEVTRATVLKLAVLSGLQALERQYR